MSREHDGAMRALIERIYRAESRRVFATLMRLLGDFDLVEEALHEAFTAAVQQWPADGVPVSPRAWLIKVGRLRGIDALRRKRAQRGLGVQTWPPPREVEQDELIDDQLRLLFMCCHPELPSDAQVALTLRELCGLTTEEIARAYLTKPSTIAQRIVRAKQRLRERGVRFEDVESSELASRSARVMRVIYLIFNEGYAASSGKERVRRALCVEAIRLARMLVEFSPSPEADGLLGLLLLQDARRQARTTAAGDIVLLAEQDRALWDRELIAEGTRLVERSLAAGAAGPYALQAAIAAVYAESVYGSPVDWAQIVALYDVLCSVAPSPIAELARAIAVAEHHGPAAGLALVEAIADQAVLDDYVPAHAARADLCRRLDRTAEALASLRRANELTRQDSEQRFFRQQIERLEKGEKW